jgi:hypothetical protein
MILLYGVGLVFDQKATPTAGYIENLCADVVVRCADPITVAFCGADVAESRIDAGGFAQLRDEIKPGDAHGNSPFMDIVCECVRRKTACFLHSNTFLKDLQQVSVKKLEICNILHSFPNN